MESSKFQLVVISILILQTAILTAIFFQKPVSRHNKNNIEITETQPGQESYNTRQTALNEIELTHKIQTTITDVLQRELQYAFEHLPMDNQRNADSHNQQLSISKTTTASEEQLLQSENSATESHSIIAQSISNGVWTLSDTQKISVHLPNLSEPQRIQLLEQLHGAINRQEVELEDIPIL